MTIINSGTVECRKRRIRVDNQLQSSVGGTALVRQRADIGGNDVIYWSDLKIDIRAVDVSAAAETGIPGRVRQNGDADRFDLFCKETQRNCSILIAFCSSHGADPIRSGNRSNDCWRGDDWLTAAQWNQSKHIVIPSRSFSPPPSCELEART